MRTRLTDTRQFMRAFVDRASHFSLPMAQWLCAVLLSWVGLPGVSHAGSFHVTPVKVTLSSQTTTYVLKVENNGTTNVTLQLKTLEWTQQDGRDQLQPTREVLVTPPLFNLKSGATQIVRLALMRKPDADRELSYRLLLEEVPSPPAADFKGVQIALRIGIPIFVTPVLKAKQDLGFTTFQSPDGQWHLNVANRGLAHSQITGVTLYATGTQDSPMASYSNATYVLPGQARSLVLTREQPLSATGARLAVRAQTRSGLVESYADLITP